ncbi:hypothetical protein ACM66B_003128 [Microbotryomycetes sp. NB124-2]
MHSTLAPPSPAVGTPRTRTRLGKKEKAQQRKHDDEPTPSSSSRRAAALTTETASANRRPLPVYSLSSPIPTAQSCPVLFSKDSAVCFVASGSTVKVYATDSCELLSTLSVRNSASGSLGGSRQRSLVSALVLNPANSLQLVVASLDGTLRVWDYSEGVLVRTIDVGAPVLHACASERLSDHIFVALAASATESSSSSPAEDGDTAQERKRKRLHKNSSSTLDDLDQFQDSIRNKRASIYSVSLRPTAASGAATAAAALADDDRAAADDDATAFTSAATPRASARRLRLAQPRTVVALAISASGEHLVALNTRTINVCRTKTLQKGFTTQLESTEALTTIAMHPNENYFATGNARGQIKLWYDVLGGDEHRQPASTSARPATAMFHWHAHAVAALAFTPNGAYLMSGGEEAVLVMWQLHTGHHEFVPRLGAPILALSITDNSSTEQQVAARLRDGSIVFVGSQKLRISKTISGLKADPVRLHDVARRSNVRVPLTFDPITRSLVLPAGHPSSLQFYSPADDAQTLELEVAPSNRVSAASEVPLEPTRVEYAVFSSPSSTRSTSWLATLDSWSNGTFASSRQLKFWQRRSSKTKSSPSTSFSLTTRIDKPHDDVITSMQFSPSLEMPLLLTTSLDGRIKLWSFDGQAWACRTSLMYRAMVPLDASWSQDGSMFAVAHERVVTLWSTYDNKLIQAFTCSDASAAPMERVAFAGKEGTMLLAGGKHGTMAWDLMTFTETHNLSFEVGVLAPRPHSNHVVAIERRRNNNNNGSPTSTAFVIDPSANSKKPASTYDMPLQPRQAIWFDPSPLSSSSSNSNSNNNNASPFDDDRFAVSLAVVNDSGNVSLVGSSAVSSVGGAVAPSRLPMTKKSGQSRLFDEIFGVDDDEKKKAQDERRRKTNSLGGGVVSLTTTGVAKGASGTGVLDMPAHSLPPPRMLWRTLFSEYQVSSSSNVSSKARAGEDDAEASMDVDEQETIAEDETAKVAPVTYSYSATPTDALTDIFRTKFLLSSPTKRAAVLGKAPPSAT